MYVYILKFRYSSSINICIIIITIISNTGDPTSINQLNYKHRTHKVFGHCTNCEGGQ